MAQIPDEWVLKERPKPGSIIEVYGFVVALSEKELAEEISRDEGKRRKQIEIYQNENVRLNRKRDKRFWDVPDGAKFKLVITVGIARSNDGRFDITEIKSIAPIDSL